MDDVERLFRGLVEALSENDAERLRAPFQISEVYQTILPYRRFRAVLGFDTNQDYEMTLLRLLAGAGGFASIDPPEAQQAMSAEANAVNPNPGAFRDFAAAKVFLNAKAVASLHADDEHHAYAPPAPEPETIAPTEPERPAAPVYEAVTQPGTPITFEAEPIVPEFTDHHFQPPPGLETPVSIDTLADTLEAPSTGTACRGCRADLPDGQDVR